MIVDGDAKGSSIYRAAFQARGCDVQTATEEDAAFALAQKVHPEIMVLDLKLSAGSGLNLLRRVRASEDLKWITVVVCSSSYVPSALDDAWSSGADLVITRLDHPPKEIAELTLQQAGAARGPWDGVTSLSPNESGGASLAQWKAVRRREHATITSMASPVPAVAVKLDTPSLGVSVIRQPLELISAHSRMELAREFLTQAPVVLQRLRTELKSLALPDGQTTRLQHLYELHSLTRSLAGGSSLMGLTNVARTSQALKTFLADLAGDLTRITEPRIRVLARGIDLVASQTMRTANPEFEDATHCRVLVVCNEEFTLHAVSNALEQSGLEVVTTRNAKVALELVTETPFELIVVDYDDLEEHLDSFTLCHRLHAIVGHATTPILLIHEGEPTFELKQNVALSTANDSINTPLLDSELRLHALCLVSRGAAPAIEA